MDWYYAKDNQQQGPVSEVEVTGLVTSGVITDSTLVWHEGMADWQPYGAVKAGGGGMLPTAPSASPETAPGTGRCAECGTAQPLSEMIELGEAPVCAACKPLRLQKLREGADSPPAGEMQYAGFWIRFAAKFIDGLVVGAVIGIPLFLLLFNAGTELRNSEPFAALGLQILVSLIEMGAKVAYNTFFIGRYGATLGKMAVKIKVITADGAPPTYWRAFGRAWAEQLSGMVCYIGYIMVAFDNQRRGLHDHLCNTRVVLK